MSRSLDRHIRDLKKLVHELGVHDEETPAPIKKTKKGEEGLRSNITQNLVRLGDLSKSSSSGDVGQDIRTRQEIRILSHDTQVLLGRYSKKKHDATGERFIQLAQEQLYRIQGYHGVPKEIIKNQARRERRRQIRKNRPHIPTVDPPELELPPAHITMQELEFKREVKENDEKMDEYLNVISHSLAELLNLAQTMGHELDLHAQQIDQVDTKMEATTDKLDQSNQRLNQLAEDAGTMCSRCTVAVLVVVLLAIVSYIFSVA